MYRKNFKRFPKDSSKKSYKDDYLIKATLLHFNVKIFGQNTIIPIQIVNGFFNFYNVTWEFLILRNPSQNPSIQSLPQFARNDACTIALDSQKAIINLRRNV
jgi:hypothetical protein